MEKLRCTSCGAELQIEDNKEYAVCNHCGSKYKLNEDLNINIKLDDNVKEVLNTSFGTVKHMSKFMFVPIIMFVVIAGLIIYFAITSMNNTRKTNEDNQKKSEEKYNQQEEILKRDMFNSQFMNDNGTKSAFFLKSTLDEIVQSNKTNDKKVTLVYDGKETTDEKEIINIKQSLDGNYEVSFNYDEAGYINKIVVEIIK